MLMTITLKNILHPNDYNYCDICNRKHNLNECNNCLELYCIKCEIFKKNMCSYCYKRNIKLICKKF
jgi:hypothetical protein